MFKYLVLALVLGFIPLPINAAAVAPAPEELKNLAEQGDARAQSHLGYLYYVGEGVPQSFTEAVKWYEKAAVQGDKDAQYNLAVAYAFGEGVNQDFTQATLWYRRAADQGHPVAQYSLGISYAYGEGVAQDQKIAADWFLKSAQAGYVKAQVMVGSLYHTGDGLPKDYAQAAQWYRKAADQGDAAAQYNLGSLYRAGKGVEKDVDEAVKLFHQSANQGYEAAQKELSSLERALAAASRDQAATAAKPATVEPQTHLVTPTPTPQSDQQEQVQIAPDSQADKPLFTTETAPQIVQENPQETVPSPAQSAPPSAAPTETTEPEVATSTTETPISDSGAEPKRGGFLSGLKKFFTRAPAPETTETSTPVTEPPAPRSIPETAPATPQTTAEVTAQASTDMPEQTPAQAVEPASIYPSTESVTADFHKDRSDDIRQKYSREESSAAITHGEGAKPADQRLAEHPETAPASPAETLPESAPPVIETPVEPRITAKAESAETAPVPQQVESPAESETTEKSGGGLRGFFGKLFGRGKDAATPTTTATIDSGAATSTQDTAIPAATTAVAAQDTLPITEQTQTAAEAPHEDQTIAETTEKPVVIAKADTETQELPLAESVEEELQTTSLDTLTARAVEGDVEAQYQLGKSYYLGDQVNRDYSLAFLWYRRAALQGHTEAQYNLGTMYLMGEGIEQSDTEAENWYEQAAAQGHEAARHNLENLQRIPASQEIQAESTEVAMTEEEPKKKGGVLGYLGRMFKSDEEEAEEDASVEEEEPITGTLPSTAETSAPADEIQAVATPGQSDYEKGLAYSEGEGVPQNDYSAFKLFDSAAQQNYAPAQYQLGNSYMGGYGTEKNPEAAIVWYEKSARQGYAPAQRTLASIYLHGENGIRQNKPLALAWYSILSSTGNVLDMHRRDVLKEELSETEVRESEKLKLELSAGLPSASAAY